MGDVADDMFDMEQLYKNEQEDDILFWRDRGYWTTQDGRRVKITDIDDPHLLNIDKLLRRHRCISQWPEITKEIKRRGITND